MSKLKEEEKFKIHYHDDHVLLLNFVVQQNVKLPLIKCTKTHSFTFRILIIPTYLGNSDGKGNAIDVIRNGGWCHSLFVDALAHYTTKKIRT